MLFDHHRSAPSQPFLIDETYDCQLHPTQYLSFQIISTLQPIAQIKSQAKEVTKENTNWQDQNNGNKVASKCASTNSNQLDGADR